MTSWRIRRWRGAILLAALAGVLLGGAGCGRRGGSAGRVVVIGLDGATWDLLQPWIDKGDLPTLARIQQNGAWGDMQSVVPYLSPSAWTSAVTGVNPGKHAIFDFQRRIPGEVVIVNETAKSRRAQPIWNMLRASKKRVLIMNIPMTDPPDEVNGLFIAGFPHPDQNDWTWPPDYQGKLGDYELDHMEIKLPPGQEDSLLATYARQQAERRRVVLGWLKDEPFDLLWAVFTASDRIQHTFWMFLDPLNPNYDPVRAQRFGGAIHDLWVEQDRILGEILQAARKTDTVLFLSDHGFGPLRYDVRVPQLMRAAGSRITPREAQAVYALAPGDAARLYVSRRGRDPGAQWSTDEAQRIRAKLADALRAARDPANGERVVETLWNNEDVFHGTYAEKGPDLIALAAQGYFLTFGENLPPDAPVIGAHGPLLSGWHRMNGIYALLGPGVAPGRRNGEGGRLYSLLDVVPSLLYAMGEPIPAGLDGQLMREVIDPARLEKHPPRATGPLEEDYRETTPEELENLKNLPYVGN
jgi:predicted AlkP superfamily phosphohydrolase/phosphomutase